MRRIRRWNVRQDFGVELDYIEQAESPWIDTDGNELPPIVQAELNEIQPGCYLLIPFQSVGYYDPGKNYGPPENCYPPEGDDERTLDGLVVVGQSHASSNPRLSLAASEALFDFYESKIYDMDLEDSQAD